MSAVSHSHHGLGWGRDGDSWRRECRAQLGGIGCVTGDARALPMREVGTLLTYDGTDVESNLSVVEKTSALQCAGNGDGRRRW